MATAGQPPWALSIVGDAGASLPMIEVRSTLWCWVDLSLGGSGALSHHLQQNGAHHGAWGTRCWAPGPLRTCSNLGDIDSGPAAAAVASL